MSAVQAFFTRTALFVADFLQSCVFGYDCASLALRTAAEETFMASPVFLEVLRLSERHTRFREFASIPGRVYARSRSPGSSTGLCAVIHLCEGQGQSRAAGLGAAREGPFRWVGSLGS